MKLDNISKNLLEKIASIHEIPQGAVSFRKNGKSQVLKSTENIVIEPKENGAGINIYIRSSCKGEACHIPVVVTDNGLFDLVYNDFYIEDNASVVIVAGCGVHSSGESGHDGIHTFHVGKNANVKYIENHLALGKGKNKILNPTTILKLDEGAVVEMETTQLGGVTYSNRQTKANLKKGASLSIVEKILTDRFDVAKTNFKIDMVGENSKCNIVSRSVARGESEQSFKSNLVGKNSCFGHVECDGILLDRAVINSIPQVSAKSNQATLTHEASIGKIASDQILKLMTLGLTENEAESKIIEGFLK